MKRVVVFRRRWRCKKEQQQRKNYYRMCVIIIRPIKLYYRLVFIIFHFKTKTKSLTRRITNHKYI